LLVAAMAFAGCMQGTGNSGQVPGGPGPATGGTPPRYEGPRFAPNITAAADTLGVSREQLEAALNSTSPGRMNLTSAAEQLGVTRQQLADALGFQFNASRQRPGPEIVR